MNNPMEFAQNRIDSRQYILLPKIADLIALNDSMSILDYGCGEGYLSRYLKAKTVSLGLYDLNPSMSDLANTNANANQIETVLVFETKQKIPSNFFDCVVLSLVLMTIEEDDEYLDVLVNCNNAMKRNGCLIIGITHPCFRQALFSTHHTKYSLGTEFNYFDNKVPFDVFLRTSKSERFIHFEDFHHTLSYTFAKLKEAGFIVDDLIELKDQSIENSYYNQTFSPYLILKCKHK